VVIHGGSWRPAYGADLACDLAEDLVRHGLAAWNLEYRRVGDDPDHGGGGWPATCRDVAAAVDLLAATGQTLAAGRLDLSRVVAIGHSAGGQLAGWLAGRGSLPADAPGASPVVPSTHDDAGPALPQPEPHINGIALADRATRRTWVEF
jgi:acetyl esterase/lipase